MADSLLRHLTRRYGNVDARIVESIMAPALLKVIAVEQTVARAATLPGEKGPWVAHFRLEIMKGEESFLTRGRTGKFVPQEYAEGSAPWREIAKGRVLHTPTVGDGETMGEVYVGGSSSKARLIQIVATELKAGDYLELDRYGASAKITSALVEASFVEHARQHGFTVRRMPEDLAKHIGTYFNYDFEIEKDDKSARVEVKSLWGTDTTKARLIRSKGRDNQTSSCQFASQDIFAVSRFLRTGELRDWAFCRSVSDLDDPAWGLPIARTRADGKPIPEHVTQNPPIADPPQNPPWFTDIDSVFTSLPDYVFTRRR
jgi:hypothetical protein